MGEREGYFPQKKKGEKVSFKRGKLLVGKARGIRHPAGVSGSQPTPGEHDEDSHRKAIA